jgi:hypothetical protein
MGYMSKLEVADLNEVIRTSEKCVVIGNRLCILD